MIKITDLAIELSTKQFINNGRLGFLKKRLDTLDQRLKGCETTEDMAKEDLNSIIEELSSIHKWIYIGIMAGLVGLLGVQIQY
jgi:hypothetical protein